MNELTKIKGLNRVNIKKLFEVGIFTLFDLVTWEDQESNLLQQLRKKFPNSNLPSHESIENWVQQAKLVRKELLSKN